MPVVPLPENCKWPKPSPPSDGLVASLLASITLINSRCVQELTTYEKQSMRIGLEQLLVTEGACRNILPL
eukprot:1159965-Pelagomonas_calceolata.AAC.10